MRGAHGLEGLALRYGFFYGPGTAIAPGGQIGRLVARRRFPVVGDGAGIWSLVHMTDVAAATLAALEHAPPGVYNIADDDPAPLARWLPAFAGALAAKPPRHVPAWLVRPFSQGDPQLEAKGLRRRRPVPEPPRTRSWSAATKNRSARRWNGHSRSCRCGPASPSGTDRRPQPRQRELLQAARGRLRRVRPALPVQLRRDQSPGLPVMLTEAGRHLRALRPGQPCHQAIFWFSLGATR